MTAALHGRRVAIGGLVHETNTYATAVTGSTGIDQFTVLEGRDLLARLSPTAGYVGGMLTAAAELGAEVVPSVHAAARPSGTIVAKAYTALRDRLVHAVAAAGPVDAVCLSLHGAGAVEGIDDLEGDLALALRKVIGPDVPLLCTLDLHGNVTDRMADEFDAMLGVQLYPHTDAWERGHELVSLLPRLLRGTKLVTHVEHLPMLLPGSTTDAGHPAAAMNDVCREIEAATGIVDCTVFHGFPFTDTPDVGVHVVCIADGDRQLAIDGARAVAQWIWDHRDDFAPSTRSPEAALAEAAEVDGLVVVNDTADNPGGGTPGDGTHVLRAMLASKLRPACFGLMYDAEVVRAAIGGGPGATIDVRLGGKHGALHGAPIEGRALVKTLTDGRFTLQAIGAGTQLDVGPTARLLIDGVDVVVSSRAYQVYDPEIFLLHGIDVCRYRVVGLKSTHHFRAGYRDIAAGIITADSPGLTTQRVAHLPRERATRPMWPLDPEASWPS